MARNRYTKLVHKLERKQIEHQEGRLAVIDKRLRKQSAEPMEVPPFNTNKVRRSARVEQKRRHKAKRRTAATNNDQK